MEKFLKVGIITSTHGLKGEVKVYPTTDDMRRFERLDSVVLRKGGHEQELSISGVRYFKNLVILKFEGMDRIEDVENLRQAELFVPREDGVPLEENEYYIADLIGMKVYENENFIGTIADVMQTGANDVYVVASENYGEVLIPAIKQCVKEVGIESGIMRVTLLPGLLPEEENK